MTSLKSWFVTAGSIALLLCLSGGTALADLEIHGSTSGTFHSAALSPLLRPLNRGSSGPTLTGHGVAPTTGQQINLGTFSLAALVASFDPRDFRGITFREGAEHFRFANSQGYGSFDLSITDVRLTTRSSGNIIGTLSNAAFAATPEPTSIVLISTLLGIVTVLFRKRLGAC